MNTTFSLLAFKALDARADGLWSPKFPTRWDMEDTPWGKFPVLHAKPGDVEAGFGVHAGDWRNAGQYPGKIYLVAPHPEYEVAAEERGWRAQAALCLGNVLSLGSETVGKAILAAAQAGLLQINDVVAWAACAAQDADALIETRNQYWMYRAALVWPAKRWTTRITQALVETGVMYWVLRAGEEWPRHAWSPALAEAVAKDDFWSYEALANWPGDRAEVVKALAKNRQKEVLP